MSKRNACIAAIIICGTLFYTAGMGLLCAASGAQVVTGTGWRAISATLEPRSHVRLACPRSTHGTDFDAATLAPFTLTQGRWVDGGEAMVFYARYRVALARPSQHYGLDRIDFTSYARRVAVEIICES